MVEIYKILVEKLRNEIKIDRMYYKIESEVEKLRVENEKLRTETRVGFMEKMAEVKSDTKQQ